MIPNRPAMPFYARDWISDASVSAMGPIARAGYFDLICMCWVNDGIPAPDGTPSTWRALATMARLTPAEIKKAWPEIEPHFEVGTDGRLRNKRATRIKRELDEHAEKRAVAGRKGAEAKWQTHGKRMANA